MTRGAGRSRGYRPQDSELRPGKVVVPFGENTTICPACRQHRHGSCWAHLAAIYAGGEPGCPCGCHVPLDEPLMTDEAIDDMAAHGTLAEHIKLTRAVLLGPSFAAHYPEVCRRCTAREAARNGGQAELPLEGL
ncbi:hypothetical protein QBA57_21445 [Streptomyces scabiei]|uniref:hypothetical protein n=1 Tax=Streptomyces scabiei TaxID=1930 RepID=UPI000765CE37|nr:MULTISPECIES: hypothetical protein [Streptomyces]MBP5884516.1 hypothetical protein [Streptomyces sp. LBUM 1487]MBP5915885.1 hypothetical protein [Streptomyces sp. LBUM 1486]MDX2629168.1 hypothetical protein [Streptomyces scabiei]MDX3030246.1 hypothetical protein [Streptomyces scabiei]MDX3168265.1 hypothetical protein [Streptomyces scabiei]